MMGTSDPQPSLYYHISLEQFVTADHPMRKIRPLIDTARIRQLCEPLYADTGRPSIPPEQLFLALLGGYLLGVTSERALVRELAGNLVLRWFVGLDLDTAPWDHSTFSQNRKRRFTESGLLEQLFDESVAPLPSSSGWSRPIRRSMGRWCRPMHPTRVLYQSRCS